MIKITAGKYKGKKLDIISKYVRPTSSIKREAFFSIIDSYGFKISYNFYYGKTFVDLFAGLGTMGLEAISRGFNYAIFYENNDDVLKILKKNCNNLIKKEQYEIIEQNILSSSFRINFENISIIYIDPPYNKYDIGNLLSILQNKINRKTIIGVESDVKDNFNSPNKLNVVKQKIYGKTKLSFLTLS
tara:strand:+ start:37 stop:597 length:561 start_codon:yes stop_codon:yes gene_type:complete